MVEESCRARSDVPVCDPDNLSRTGDKWTQSPSHLSAESPAFLRVLFAKLVSVEFCMYIERGLC